MINKRYNLGLIIPIIVYFVAVFSFLEDHYSLFDFPLDDAWIHCVYARSFAHGHGFEYNTGQQEAGTTSPLWVIASSPAQWMLSQGTDAAVCTVKLVGVLLGLAIVLATQRITLQITGSRLAGGIAASLIAIEPKLLLAAFSGMETCLLIAIWTWACIALINKRFMLFIILMSLTPVTRPESLVVLPFAVIGICGIFRTQSARWIKISAVVIPFLPMALWSLFCVHVNGHLLPNTFYVKALPFHLGLSELKNALQAVTRHGFSSLWYIYWVTLVIFLFHFFKNKSAIGWTSMILIIMPIVFATGVAGSREIHLEGYYWMRWIDPASICMTVPFCIGYSILLTKWTSNGSPPGSPAVKKRGVFLSSISMICLILSIPGFQKSFMDRRRHLASDSRDIAIMNVGMGKWINQNTAKDAVVAVNDAGAIRYFGQRRTIDLVGLNSADIAFGKISPWQAITASDWLAVFPHFVSPLLPKINELFEPRIQISIPMEEYTICYAPGQTLSVAFQKKSSNPAGKIDKPMAQ